MAPFGPEEDDVGLHHVVLVEHDVERRDERDSARPASVVAQQHEQLGDRDLVTRQRRRDHDELSSVDLVAAPVLRQGQKVAVAEPRLHVLHGRHRNTGTRMRNACRAALGTRAGGGGKPAPRVRWYHERHG